MIIFFFDRFWNPLGKASAKLPKGVTYYDDHEVEDVETGTSTFEVYVGFDEENRNIVRAYGQEATYFVTTDQEGHGRLWSVIDDESDEEAMFHYFYGEDAGMDLINEMLPAWGSPGSAKPIVYYIERAAADSGFEIGINEIPNLTRTLEWDGEATGLNRLQSIFTQFDNAELQFRFDIDENTLELKHKYIDILKKRGNDTGIELRMNREVKNIRMKRSRANMFNAYRCYGATPEGKENPITLNGYSLTTAQKEINPETGKARFVLSGNILKDTESNAKYSRYLNPYEQGEDEGYYTGIYNSEATTQNALANETILQLKKTGYPEVNYEVDVIDAPRTLKAGDYVSIVNDKDELYLEGRILKTDRSRSNDTFEITLGDYLIRDSGIAEQIQAMADKLKGKDGVSNFIFYAYADDEKGTGFSLNPQGKKYTGLTVSLVNQQPSDPSVYTWSLSKGDDGEDGQDGKDGEDGQDGQDGLTYFPHRAWMMANGTFTKEYPNENLLNGSSNWTELDMPSSSYFTQFGTEVEMVPGKTYTFSIEVKKLVEDSVPINLHIGLGENKNYTWDFPTWRQNNIPMNSRVVLTYTIKTTDIVNLRKYFAWRLRNEQRATKIAYRIVKLEESDTATIFTTPPSVDYENAYPKYEGFYSDTNQIGSDNPDDYKPWTPFMGPQGPTGGIGPTGPPGANAQEVFSGYLTNEAIVLPANSAGTVTDFSAANGTFITFLGQTQQTTGVAYSLVSQSGITANINASTGVYTVTAASADMGMAIFRAVRNGVTIQKQIIVTKSKQGSAGKGVISTDITYQVGSSGTTTPTGNWLSAIPTVPAGQFLWTRTIWTFSDSTSKTGYSVSKSGETGATGNGISATSINYVASTSSTTVPTSGWTAAIPAVPEGQYLWTRTRLTYTNGNTNESYTVSKQGQKGDPTGLVAQSTVPTSPYVGMLWRNTGTNNGYLLNGTYRWNGSAWEIYVFIAANISVENLAAIVSRIGEIYNDYSRTYNDNTTAIGTLSIKDAEINNSGVIRNSSGVVTQSYEQILSHQLLSMARYSGSAAGDQNELIASASLSFDTLTLNDRANGFSGMIHARQLTDTPWINLSYAAGFRTSENNPCQYQISYNMKGKRTITFRGQVERTSGAMTGTTYPFGIGTVPASIRPTGNTFKLAAGDATELQTVRVAMLGTAQPSIGNSIQIKVVGNSQYVDISALTYDIP
ncbi:phage tail protein [Candidatus Enterococcus avicola]